MAKVIAREEMNLQEGWYAEARDSVFVIILTIGEWI